MVAAMKEVIFQQRVAVTTDGCTRVREIQYQGKIDGMGKFHPVRRVGKLFSTRRSPAAAPVRKEAA